MCLQDSMTTAEARGRLCTAVLALSCPALRAEEDTLAFLVDQLISEGVHSHASPDSIDYLIGEYLETFDLCRSSLEKELLCEKVHTCLSEPDEEVQAVCAALQQGRDLHSALDREQDPVDDLPAGACQLCERTMPLTDHHLFPRQIQKKYIRRGLMQGNDRARVLRCCRQCHNTIHKLFDHDELASSLNNREALLGDEKIQKWVSYAQKQKSNAVQGLRVAR